MENSNETTIRKETGLLYEDGSPVLFGDEVLGLDERWHVVTAVELDATGWRVCKRCGRWFRYARGGIGRRPAYCSDVCRGTAMADRKKVAK